MSTFNTSDLVFLRQNVMMEPLFNEWYAWPHLISPATAVMNIKNRHIPLMESFIHAPEIHEQAVSNPKMLGGPFIDISQVNVEQVQALLDKTLEQSRSQIVFAEAIEKLNNLLKHCSNGYSLEPLYNDIPKPLRGKVELVYDLNNCANFRFFEALLYYGESYNPSSQSIILSLILQDERPFVLSTPRVGIPETLHLPLPFCDDAIDILFSTRHCAKSFGEIVDTLRLEVDQIPHAAKFFSLSPQCQYSAPLDRGVRIRYFGHACVLIETQQCAILVDPVISYQYNDATDRYAYPDLPAKIDAVLITHNHQDHVLLETLLQLRYKVDKIIVPKNSAGFLQDPSLCLMFKAIGFTNVMELAELDTLSIGDCVITGIPFLGEHCDLMIASKLAYAINVNNKTILFAADSCNIDPDLYVHLRSIIGKVDVLFLGMECDGAPLSWLYGALLPEPISRKMDRSRRLAGCNYERAAAMVDVLECGQVFVYAMGQEPWLNYVMSIKYTEDSHPIVASGKLLEYCQKLGIYGERLLIKKEILLDG